MKIAPNNISEPGFNAVAARDEDNQSLRMKVLYRVLEGAKDNKDEFVIAACRRLITANTVGKDLESQFKKDWDVVKSFS